MPRSCCTSFDIYIYIYIRPNESLSVVHKNNQSKKEIVEHYKTKMLPWARRAIFLISGGVFGPCFTEVFLGNSNTVLMMEISAQDCRARTGSIACTLHGQLCRLGSACMAPFCLCPLNMFHLFAMIFQVHHCERLYTHECTVLVTSIC